MNQIPDHTRPFRSHLHFFHAQVLPTGSCLAANEIPDWHRLISLAFEEERPHSQGFADIRIFRIHYLTFGQVLLTAVDHVADPEDATFRNPSDVLAAPKPSFQCNIEICSI